MKISNKRWKHIIQHSIGTKNISGLRLRTVRKIKPLSFSQWGLVLKADFYDWQGHRTNH